MENPDQMDFFNQARYLLEDFRHGDKMPSEVLDYQKFARFFAITDLMGYHHGTSLYNHKFYYNPIESRLEPIGYDNQAIIPIQKDPSLETHAAFTGESRYLFTGERADFKSYAQAPWSSK